MNNLHQHHQNGNALNRLSIHEAPLIPEDAYMALPPSLKSATDFFADRNGRDIFLVGALPVLAACMPNVRGRYGQHSYSPDFYVAILGRAGAGKGVLRWARMLGEVVEKQLGSSGRAGKGGRLFLPGNTSAAGLYGALDANEGHGLLFETELDTLTVALGQDWGNFSDVIRKAFEHEPLSLQRRDEHRHIADPCLSMTLSGTPEQILRLVPSTENGLFSRLAFLYTEPPLQWIDQRPRPTARRQEEYFEDFARMIFDLYTDLSRRENHLQVALASHHWDQINKYFSSLYHAVDEGTYPAELSATFQRGAVIAFRIAMLLRVLQTLDMSQPVARVPMLEVFDRDMEASLLLTGVFMDHAIRLAPHLPTRSRFPTGASGARFHQFYQKLPESFTRNDAESIAEDFGIAISTVTRYLSKLVENGSVERVAHGLYRKQEI